jgi:3-mercaptopyruvate sulfurtransferase SseA
MDRCHTPPIPAVDVDVVVGQEDATAAETSHIPCAVGVHCRTMHVLDSPHVHPSTTFHLCASAYAFSAASADARSVKLYGIPRNRAL